jgi:hypothetical protein
VRGDGSTWSVVDGITHDDWAQDKIRITTEELLSEREEVKELLPG